MCSHTFYTIATTLLVLFSLQLTHVAYVAVLAKMKAELWSKPRALADTLCECGEVSSLSTASSASEDGIKITQPCAQCQKSYISKLRESLKQLNSFINPPFYLRWLFCGEYNRLIELFDDRIVALEAQIKTLTHSEACSHHKTQPPPFNTTDDRSSQPADRAPEFFRTFPDSRKHATGVPPSATNLRRHSSCPQLPPFGSSTEHRSPETVSPNSVSNRGALIGDIHIHLNNVGNVWGTKYNYTEVEDHSTHKRPRGAQHP